MEKPSLSRSEEFLAQISTELTDEALFVAGYHVNPVPSKEKQTQDQETQIYKHARNPRSLLPSPSVGGHVLRDSPFSDWGLYFQKSSPRPKAPTLALTGTMPAPRHTFCHPVVTRELCLAAWPLKDDPNPFWYCSRPLMPSPHSVPLQHASELLSHSLITSSHHP
ncbi:uncharacterized protein LOC111823403 isoform X5 [Myotis lucifugus]|uniref:uncharacterized protein LOC111823403 isoform X5 n=1 Tax=Myotis lucifugus TaxID=59463 RepID=UPI000CCC44BF|nr:uncharacterized protein LOC111823403 isoform X5 [Myotis lucifugus]XP_023600410.1 uncharacterized protein LOC111823403 isoform X5 [Myotis lucifugus]